MKHIKADDMVKKTFIKINTDINIYTKDFIAKDNLEYGYFRLWISEIIYLKVLSIDHKLGYIILQLSTPHYLLILLSFKQCILLLQDHPCLPVTSLLLHL